MKNIFTLIAIIYISSFSLNAQEWSENFESGSIPSNWTIISNATDGGFLVGSDLSSNNWTISPHTIYAGTNDNTCLCDKSNEYLITHKFGIPVDETYALYLSYFFKSNYGIGDAAIKISNDDGETWDTLTTMPELGDWTNSGFLLEGYSGDSVMLSFYNDDDESYAFGLMIDDIFVAQANIIAEQVVTPEIHTTEDGPFQIEAYFYNNGLDEITEIQMHYQVDEETEVVDTITGLSIATFERAIITSITGYDATTMGDKTITVWATQINNVAGTESNEVSGGLQFTDQHTPKIGLSETFTSNTCGPCAEFNPPYQLELDTLNTNEVGSGYVAIRYQVNWPSPSNDVCYNSDVLKRRNYYGINSVPTTLVEGIVGNYDYASESGSWSESATNVALQFEDLSEQHGWVNIITSVLWDGISEISVDVSITPNVNFEANTQTLYVGVMNLHYDNTEISPNGTNGETEWDYVMRKMLPDGNGTSLGALTTGITENYNLTYSFSIGNVNQGTSHLVNENIGVIAWVQDDNTGAVRNASLGDMSLGLEEVSTVSDFQIYPNPTSDIAHISLNLAESNNVTIEVTDLLGKVVYAEEKGRLQAGNHTFDVDAASIGNGMYLFNVYVDTQKVTKRISITK